VGGWLLWWFLGGVVVFFFGFVVGFWWFWRSVGGCACERWGGKFYGFWIGCVDRLGGGVVCLNDC